jgi:XisI protein
MVKVKKYQKIILSFLQEFASIRYTNAPELEQQIIADTTRNHFQLVNVGWYRQRFTHDTLFHIDIKNNKIWIQQNETEVMIADELIAKGVRKNDIVLGFVPEYIREYTGFAVN